MQSTTTKIWVSLGLATTLTACSERVEQAAPAPAAETMAAQSQPEPVISQEDFTKALGKLLAGEGGEGGGTGMTFENRKLIIRAWTGEQIQTALSGNSFLRGEDIALHFKADGTFTGFEHPYLPKDASVCEKAGNAPGFDVHEGQCRQRTEFKITDGKWSVKDDMLCTTPALPQIGENLECTQVIAAIDRIALFSADGTMLSKGIDLRKTP